MPDPLPAPARRRLGLILARLGSDHDGEALNAARLACRLLAEHGLRPEDLAGLAPEAPRREERRQSPPPWEEARRPRREADDLDEVEPIDDAADFAEQLLAASLGLSVLTPKDLAFLRDLIDRGWNGAATPKQARWLRDMEERLTRRRHRA